MRCRILLVLLLSAGCSSSPVSSLDASDAGAVGDVATQAYDLGLADTGTTADAGEPDADSVDTGTTSADAGEDAAVIDSGVTDADAPDVPVGPDSGLLSLGEACSSNPECSSGYCYDSRVCSECATSGDCGIQRDCVYRRSLGYAICVGTGDLGDSCTNDNQCTSGFCNTGICSECSNDPDCTNGGTCRDDTSGLGYWVCSGGLGDRCQSGADCASGFCMDPPFAAAICSECETPGDCGPQQDCEFDRQIGYAVCIGNGDLGDTCQGTDECTPGTFCNTNVCSECLVGSDCGTGGSCVDDRTNSGYFICLGGLGETCNDPAECASGHCYNPPGPGGQLCSECTDDGDCTPQVCTYQRGDAYATCTGTVALGDPCASNDVCLSEFCNTNVCSECLVDTDCSGGGSCVDDTANAGYFICAGGLGERCSTGADCNSGYCYFNFACSECETNADCTSGSCRPDFGLGYATCS